MNESRASAHEAGGGPRCVLMFSRIDFAWLNPIVMGVLRRRYETRFIVMVSVG